MSVLLFSSVIAVLSTPPFHGRLSNRPSDTSSEELGPGPFYFVGITSLDGALRRANEQLSQIQGYDVQPIVMDDGFYGKIILDHEMGNIYCWELGDSRRGVAINADTGEIIQYYNFGWGNGTLTQAGALELAEEIAETFHRLPRDRSNPEIELDRGYSYDSYDYTNDTFIEVPRPCWRVEWTRMVDGMETTDRISMMIDPDGHLNYYYKDWNMRLDFFNAKHYITRDEAISIAMAEAGDGVNISDVQQIILRPCGNVRDTGFTYGTSPRCAWVVAFEYGDTYIAMLQIDGKTGRIIGRDEYC